MVPVGDGPQYTTIFRRINAQDASIHDSLSDIRYEDIAIDLVPDGTGLMPRCATSTCAWCTGSGAAFSGSP